MKKLFREPLVHFLALGLLVFLIDSFWTGGQSGEERAIHVSSSVLARLDDTWLRTTGRMPGKDDREGLIQQYVQEEALAREAQRLGMAEGDEIIRRRLAQKMRFVASGSGSDLEPTTGELKSWFEANQDKFNITERRSFSHVYFSPERHGDALDQVADATKAKLENGADWKSLGDPFMQKRSYTTLPEREVMRAFGPDFAKAIFLLPRDQWSQPIGSAFGLHLVRIEAIDQATQADFAANRELVKTAYIDEQSEARRQQEIDRIVRRYQVIVADPGAGG